MYSTREGPRDRQRGAVRVITPASGQGAPSSTTGGMGWLRRRKRWTTEPSIATPRGTRGPWVTPRGYLARDCMFQTCALSGQEFAPYRGAFSLVRQLRHDRGHDPNDDVE